MQNMAKATIKFPSIKIIIADAPQGMPSAIEIGEGIITNFLSEDITGPDMDKMIAFRKEQTEKTPDTFKAISNALTGAVVDDMLTAGKKIAEFVRDEELTKLRHNKIMTDLHNSLNPATIPE